MIVFIISVLFYFLCSWLIPWHKIPSTISFSYVFDIIYCLLIGFLFHLPWNFKLRLSRDFIKTLLEVLLLAFFSLSFIWALEVQTPFKLVSLLEWHLLVLAPIVEELVFRQTFQRILISKIGGKYLTSIIIAAIFSFSHFIGLKVLPIDYVPFIGFQVFYTFILGILCGHALQRFHSLLAPIILHFIFNLSFYVALQYEFI